MSKRNQLTRIYSIKFSYINFGKFIFGLFLFFVIISQGAVYAQNTGRVSRNVINVEECPSKIKVSQPIQYTCVVLRMSGNPLEGAYFTVEMPEGLELESVKCNYEKQFMDGTVFSGSSSYKFERLNKSSIKVNMGTVPTPSIIEFVITALPVDVNKATLGYITFSYGGDKEDAVVKTIEAIDKSKK